MPFHQHIAVYNHCTCVELTLIFLNVINALVSGIWYKILAYNYGAQIAGY